MPFGVPADRREQISAGGARQGCATAACSSSRGGGGRSNDGRARAGADRSRVQCCQTLFHHKAARKTARWRSTTTSPTTCCGTAPEFGDSAAIARREPIWCASRASPSPGTHMEPGCHARRIRHGARRRDAAHHRRCRCVHARVAACLQIRRRRLRVIEAASLGGGFGARTECLHFEIIAALLAHPRAALRCSCCRTTRGPSSPPRPALDSGEDEDPAKRSGRIRRRSAQTTRPAAPCRLRDHHHPLHPGALMHGIYDIRRSNRTHGASIPALAACGAG